MIIVRYADDIVVGFRHEADAKRFRDDMGRRLAEFALTLHPEKTRLIEFGRFAAENRARRGLGKPETFNFLGLRHICGRSRRGKFQLWRHTRADRMRAKLKELEGRDDAAQAPAAPCTREMAGTGGWRFFRLSRRANQLCGLVGLLAPRQESVAARAPAAQPEGSLDVRADGPAGCRLPAQTADPTPMAEHPFCRHTPEVGAVCLNWACTVLCGGRSAMSVPTAIRTELLHCSERTVSATFGLMQRSKPRLRVANRIQRSLGRVDIRGFTRTRKCDLSSQLEGGGLARRWSGQSALNADPT